MREEQVQTLRKLLRDVLSDRYRGVNQSRAARAQGYLDGFIAALLRSKVLTQREVLTIIAEERSRAAGPATRLLDPEPALA